MFGKLFTREPSDPRIRFIDSEVYRKMCQKFGKYQLLMEALLVFFLLVKRRMPYIRQLIIPDRYSLHC